MDDLYSLHEEIMEIQVEDGDSVLTFDPSLCFKRGDSCTIDNVLAAWEFDGEEIAALTGSDSVSEGTIFVICTCQQCLFM
jgi:hypothetical protein